MSKQRLIVCSIQRFYRLLGWNGLVKASSKDKSTSSTFMSRQRHVGSTYFFFFLLTYWLILNCSHLEANCWNVWSGIWFPLTISYFLINNCINIIKTPDVTSSTSVNEVNKFFVSKQRRFISIVKYVKHSWKLSRVFIFQHSFQSMSNIIQNCLDYYSTFLLALFAYVT